MNSTQTLQSVIQSVLLPFCTTNLLLGKLRLEPVKYETPSHPINQLQWGAIDDKHLLNQYVNALATRNNLHMDLNVQI